MDLMGALALTTGLSRLSSSSWSKICIAMANPSTPEASVLPIPPRYCTESKARRKRRAEVNGPE